jgi:quercetin dioxygenase-like cupin family protein
MSLHSALYRWDELPLEKVTEMVARKAITATEVGLTQAYFKKGAIVPQHCVPSELAVYVLQGAIRFRIGAEDRTVREGEVIVIAAGASHQSESLDDTFVLTVVACAPDTPATTA